MEKAELLVQGAKLAVDRSLVSGLALLLSPSSFRATSYRVPLRRPNDRWGLPRFSSAVMVIPMHPPPCKAGVESRVP